MLVFLLHLTSPSLLAQISNLTERHSTLTYQLMVQQALYHSGIPVPRTLPIAKDGHQLIASVQDRLCRVQEFIAGQTLGEARVRNATVMHG